jgi:hypothetical protein
MAARLAKTPLAIADAQAPGSPIMFANDAFATLVGVDAQTLVGRPLGCLAAAGPIDVEQGVTTRMELALRDGGTLMAALSTAAVRGADGRPFCLLCSLVEARGEGADVAIVRDGELLAQVAQAAGDLMRESAVAAHSGGSTGRELSAADIASAAVDRAIPRAGDERAA